MAPRKDKGKSVAAASTRVTRSMDRKTRSSSSSSSSSTSSKLMKFESPEKKKNRKRKATETEEAATKKSKKVKREEDETASEVKEEDGEEDDESEKKKIVIEHCKQCNSFKTRANQVKEGLENAVPGVVITLNADKPRRGCFEIREEGGETFISLLDMKRPFTAMKELDMEDVIKNIVEKIK
ncbi:unnamed protein product [Cochlearia groenlandica]